MHSVLCCFAASLLTISVVSAPTRDSGKAPAGLSTSDWAGIRGEYERNRHAAFPEPGGHVARNFGQRWVTHFDGRGFTVEPDGGSWKWGLQLESFGFAGYQRTVEGRVPVTTEKERVSYDRGRTMREWFVNDQRGLEHGFTLRDRPTGAGERLELRLAVRGGLRPQVQRDGRGVNFVDGGGRAVLLYAGLQVVDADGRSLEARFEAAGEGLRLEVEERGARYPLTIDPIAQQAYLKASNTGAGDFFGRSVAVSGDTVVVGAYGEASNATGVNGNQSDNSAPVAGAAYVFVRNTEVWSQQAYLKASNTEATDQFGYSVAVSGDTVVVGAFGEDSNATGVNGNQSDNSALSAGAAYVFVRTGGVWSQQAYLKASNTGVSDQFGYSVAVSGDTAVVGAYGEASNATGVNGNQSNNAASNAGAVYVFVRTAGLWSQQAYLKASNTAATDEFGYSVALDGDTVVAGTPFEDSNATGVNGNQSDNTAANAGAAYAFVRSGGVWSQQAYLKASNTGAGDEFGYTVAVSGDTVAVGAVFEASNATGVNGDQSNNSLSDAGAAYVFQRSGGVWSQQAYLKASNTATGYQFGYSVAVSGDVAVVGSYGEASNSTGINGAQTSHLAPNSGAAYLFVRSGGVWSQQAYLKASNTGQNDIFGNSVAVWGDTVVAGASQEASNATGVNGNQNDDSANHAGAAYVFLIPVNVTLDTSPVGRTVSLDGAPFVTAPLTVSLNGGSSHTIATQSPQSAGTVQYVWQTWSDGGAISHIITVPHIDTTYTGNFETQYQLSVSASPVSGGTVTPTTGGFYAAGSTVPVSATANGGFSFINWTGSVANPASASTTVTMSGPMTATANFVVSAFTLSPPSINVGVDQGNGTVTVTATVQSAPWTAVSNSPFLTITSGASGTGNGAVGYSVAANGSAPRTGTLTIAGQTFTVTQAGAGLGFNPVTPCRVVDTRAGQGKTGLFGPPSMPGNSSRSFPMLSSTCGLPPGAQAYSLNVTVVPPAPLIYLTIWPSGQTQPLVSTLNSFDGAVVANAAIVPAGQNGDVSVYVSDASDVIIDINGYFAPPDANALAFYPATPCRVSDTRLANGTFGGPRLNGGETRSYAIPQSACGIPSTAKAYSLNMTVVPPGPLIYLSTWPAGQALPVVSTLNAFDGRVAANAAIVPAGNNGAISVFVSDASDLIIDINGYFAPPGNAGALLFHPAAPCRVADTRGGFPSPFGPPQLPAGSTRNFPIPSSGCNIPGTAQAYSLNMTVVPPAPLIYLTTWPAQQAQPLVSTLNSFQGKVVANAAIVPAGAGGAISVYVSDATQLIIDVNGYFAQ